MTEWETFSFTYVRVKRANISIFDLFTRFYSTWGVLYILYIQLFYSLPDKYWDTARSRADAFLKHQIHTPTSRVLCIRGSSFRRLLSKLLIKETTVSWRIRATSSVRSVLNVGKRLKKNYRSEAETLYLASCNYKTLKKQSQLSKFHRKIRQLPIKRKRDVYSRNFTKARIEVYDSLLVILQENNSQLTL